MGASFDNWMKGTAIFIGTVVVFVLFGAVLNYYGVKLPAYVGRIIAIVVLLPIVRAILNQIFDYA